MAEFINGLKRTNMCGDLTAKDEGKNVVVMGFAAKVRNLGKKSLEEVIQKLDSLGLSLRKSDD